VSEGFQSQVTALAPVSDAADVGALPSFDHRHDGFDLGAITIGGFVEACLHEPPITALRGFVSGTATGGGNHRSHTALFAGEAVVGLGIIAGIGRNPRQSHAGQRLGKQRSELDDVDFRPTPTLERQDEVRLHITDQRELGVVAVEHGFPS
jgi:hypothetical protein